LLQSRTDEAIVWFKKALLPARTSRLLIGAQLRLASAYALKGDGEQAASELAAARGLLPHKTLRISLMKTHEYLPDPEPAPAIRALEDRTFFAGVRKAGVSEQ